MEDTDKNVEEPRQDAPAETSTTADEPTLETAEQDEEFLCNVTVEDCGAWKKKIVVEIPRAQVDKELDKQYGEMRRTLDVPGFRRGHAPRKLFEKRYGDDLTNQVKLRLLAQAFEKIDDEQDFEVLGEPDFDPEKVELPESGDFRFEYEVEVKPEFELPELEGIRVEKRVIEITDEQVTQTIDDMRRRRGSLEEVKQAEKNDLVWAEVTMKVEGIDEPETAGDVMIRVAEEAPVLGVLVKGMDKVLTGVQVGDERTCSGEVPDTHEKEEYRGKKAEFTLKVTMIRRLVPAALDKDFLESLGVESEEELRRAIREQLENEVDNLARREMSQQIHRYLDEKIDFELPAGVAARHTDRVLARHFYDLMRRGVSQEEIQENLEKLRASSSQQAARELKMSFIMEKVADELDIQVSDMELNGYIAQMAASQGRRPERLRDELNQEGRLELIRQEIREERALERILEMAEVVDAPGEDGDESEGSDAK